MENKLLKKIKELQEMCDFYNIDLMIRYYGNRQVCFIGVNENEDEVFNVCSRFIKDKKTFYYEINTKNETWKQYHLNKEDITLLLSIDELTEEELSIKNPNIPKGEKNEN